MKLSLLSMLIFLSHALLGHAQDTLSGYPGYRIFGVDQKHDMVVVGKSENSLYGTPRNNGSPELAFPTSSFLQTNRYDFIRVACSYFSLAQLERIYNQYPEGHVTIYCYFMPDGQLKEVYYGFQRYGGNIPFTYEELRYLDVGISGQIRGWYRFPENYEEQVLQKQDYIDVPMNFPIELFMKYHMGIIDYEDIYTWGGI